MPFVASVETPIEALRSKRATRVGSTDAGNPPVLQSRAGRPPERLARALDNLHPATVFVVVMLAGLAVIAALSIGLGFFVSGHTAAALAVYGGLVLLLTSAFRNSAFRALAWTFALAMVTFVATSRMYRGMHHPLDIAGGIVLGVGALIVVVFACRTAGAAAEARR